MAGKFVLKTTANDQYMFNLKASNGQIILTSETYASKDGALNGIESVKKNACEPKMFERKETAKGDPFFVLKAGNGQVIGKSETYSSASAMEQGIASVASNAPTAVIEE